MSKQINPEKLSKFDRQYLADRGIDPDEYVARYTLGDEEGEETDENTDGILSDGTAENRAGRLPTDDDNESDEDDGSDYSTWDAKALQAEVAARNEDRDEDSKIVPEGTGKEGRLRKGDLVTALQADDANVTEGDDEDDA